jgi:hypothetical protein
VLFLVIFPLPSPASYPNPDPKRCKKCGIVRSNPPAHFHITTVGLSGMVKQMGALCTAEFANETTRLVVHGSLVERDLANAECSEGVGGWSYEKGDKGTRRNIHFISHRTAWSTYSHLIHSFRQRLCMLLSARDRRE